MQGDTAARAALATVLDDLVVVDADAVIGGIVIHDFKSVGILVAQRRMADTDAATKDPGVAGEAVIADQHILGVAIDDNTAAVAGADNGETVDACALIGQQPVFLGIRNWCLGFQSQYQDTCSLLGGEHALIQCREAGQPRLLARQLRDEIWDQRPGQVTPRREFFARYLACIDEGITRTPTLQLDRLPHNHHLVVTARCDQDQVAGCRHIDGILDGAASCYSVHGIGVAVGALTDTFGRAHCQGHADGRFGATGPGDHHLVVARRYRRYDAVDLRRGAVGTSQRRARAVSGLELGIGKATAGEAVVTVNGPATHVAAVPFGVGHLGQAHGLDRDLLPSQREGPAVI